MKNDIVSLGLLSFAGLLILFAASAYAAGEEPGAVVETYFDALKSGDVQAVMTVITDPLLGSRKLLLEQNTAYPDYLRNYYRDAVLAIDRITSPADTVRTVDVSIAFPEDANPLTIKFVLTDTPAGWKISEELPTSD